MVTHIVEKLALRVAARFQGRITAHHILPYVPLSLDALSVCLEQMVDDREVFTIPGEPGVVYEFAAYRDTPIEPGALQVTTCVACDAPLTADNARVLCVTCTTTCSAALHTLARQPDWLGRTMAEHEMLYLAAQHPGPSTAAALASRSRYTLRQTRQHLERLGQHGYLHQDVDVHTGLMTYALPTIVYPTAQYQQNIAVLRTLADARRLQRRSRWWRLLAPLAGIALGVAIFAAFPRLLPWWQRQQPARQTAVEHQTPPPRAPQTAPPYATLVRISITQDGFAPMGMKLKAVQHPPLLLTARRPAGIVQEPAYQGQQQKYGALTLGTRENNVYYFALDLLPGRTPLLYVDRNQNGNLADDGEPLTNQGSGFFATTLRLPLSRLVPHGRLAGTYDAWVFTNQALWQQGLITYYSRTQLKGRVSIAGQTYTAYIADGLNNDADFTNDAIHIDLDGNGAIDPQTESFLPGSIARIHNQPYLFEVTW
jgi:hypothetical protein